MGRPKKQNREPFWRTERNCWFVHVGSRTLRLSPDKDEAWRRWHELMSKRHEGQPPPSTGPPMVATVEIIDAFLDWAQKNRERLTYEAYQRRLQAFVDSIPPSLPYSELKPYHVTRVMDANAEKWNNNSKNDFASAVQRAFNWAQAEGMISHNPLARIRKPGREARELAISPAQYVQIMKAVTEQNFRTLLELAWETGARPQELPIIEARHVDLEQRRIVFPPKEAKGKKRYRVIYLGTDRALEIIRGLCTQRPRGPLLLNSEGQPWTKDAINCAFCRLKEKLGVKYHLGAFRKGFTTEGLKNGVDTLTMAHLLGHANGAMVSRIYGQVQQDPTYMAASARKAKGNG